MCIRRIFAHEVKSVLSNSAQQRRDDYVPPIQNNVHPLPPEGQPSAAIVDGIIGGPNQDGRPSAQDVRFWQEGYYVWFTKNRWAAQEKLDLMMLDLAHQTNWIRAKEQEERAWFDNQKQRVRSVVQSANESGNGGERQYQDNDMGEWVNQDGPTRHPYPDAA